MLFAQTTQEFVVVLYDGEFEPAEYADKIQRRITQINTIIPIVLQQIICVNLRAIRRYLREKKRLLLIEQQQQEY